MQNAPKGPTRGAPETAEINDLIDKAPKPKIEDLLIKENEKKEFQKLSKKYGNMSPEQLDTLSSVAIKRGYPEGFIEVERFKSLKRRTELTKLVAEIEETEEKADKILNKLPTLEEAVKEQENREAAEKYFNEHLKKMQNPKNSTPTTPEPSQDKTQDELAEEYLNRQNDAWGDADNKKE